MVRNAVRIAAVLVLAVGVSLPAFRAEEPEKKPSRKVPVDEKVLEQIKELVAQLGHDDFAVREEATKKLSEIGRPAVPAVREAAKSGDAEVRMRARRILDKIETSVTHLIEDLKDNDPAVRKGAAEALERLGPPAKEAIPALLEALKDKDEGVREAVLLAMLTIDPDNKAIANTAPAKASVNGKYSRLLHRIKVEADKASYGEFTDYGHYTGTSWAGYNNLSPGYWVYKYPHWYIWGDMKK
jgi:HEAT repeat protein